MVSVRGLDVAGGMPPVSCTRQDSGASWETVSSWLILQSISTHRHRPPRYGLLVQQAPNTIWAASTFLGPVRLAGGMLLFVENLVTHGHLHVDDETRRLLLKMSPATIGRAEEVPPAWDLPYPEHSPGGAGSPIQTCMDPSPEDFCPIRGVLPLDIPGVLAVDLVGHNGGQAVKDFNWTLTVTDQGTGWTETGAVRTKAEMYVVAALDMTSLLHEVLLPRGCCCIRGVYWPGTTRRDCQENATSGDQETWQLRAHFWRVHDLMVHLHSYVS